LKNFHQITAAVEAEEMNFGLQTEIFEKILKKSIEKWTEHNPFGRKKRHLYFYKICLSSQNCEKNQLDWETKTAKTIKNEAI
jgi:hypothetical protein